MHRTIEQGTTVLLQLLLYNPAIGILVIVGLSLLLYTRIKSGQSMGSVGYTMIGCIIYFTLWKIGLKEAVVWLLSWLLTILIWAGVLLIGAVITGYVLEGVKLLGSGKTNDIIKGVLGRKWESPHSGTDYNSEDETCQK